MATDPDSDRLGIAIRDNQGKLLLLNGNQMASILTYYLLENISSANQLKKGEGGDYMVKTIVTTDLMKSICDFYDIEIFNVLTGFKYIAEVVRSMEGKRRFIGGGEESYGFNVGEFVRDKDAVVTCCLVAEAAVWSRERGMKLYDLLIEIYNKFGFYLEHLISMTKKGIDGKEQIDTIMKNLRNSPPESIDGSQVVLVHDYLKRETIDIVSDLRYKIGLPKSNVLQFVTSDNTIVSVRPSGTEPKIKFYIGVKGDLGSMDEFARVKEQLMTKIKRIERGFTDL
jgi:phosphoglucomutase